MTCPSDSRSAKGVANKFSGPALWAFFAGDDRARRDQLMMDARRYREMGEPLTASVCVRHARSWHRYLIKHLRYAREFA